jgi:hypothetical protein
MASNNPVTWKQLFDFSKTSDVKQAVKTITTLNSKYEKFFTDAEKRRGQYVKSMNDIVTATNKLSKGVTNLNSQDEKSLQNATNLNGQLKKLATTYDSIKGKVVALDGSVKVLTDEQKKSNESAKKTIKISNELIRLKKKESNLNTSQAKEIALVKERIIERNRALKQSAKETLGLVTLYQKESKRLNDLRKKYKDVALKMGENSKQARKLQKELTILDTKLKRVDASAGQFQRNVGGYSQALGKFKTGFMSLAGALGFTGVIFALVGAFRGAITTIREFQDGSADLAGVLGKTRAEIKPLTDEAQRLGAITDKTAKEVLDLEIAYSRLGFTQEEILNLTEDTINGSIALNAILEETAELTGAVVRTFSDLGSTDADVILDQMTAATQRSALTFEKLKTGIPIAAAAANASGVQFSTLLSLMGKLSDAGLDASMSATSLRNIFIESATSGVSYEVLLNKVANSTDKLKTANEIFGKRGAVAAVILSQQAKAAGELDKALQDVGGTAERVAKEKLDTLTGDLALLNSAWKGLILTIEDGEGVFASIARSIVNVTTGVLTSLGYMVNALKTESPFDLGVEQANELSKAIGFVLPKAIADYEKKLKEAKEEVKAFEKEHVKNGLVTIKNAGEYRDLRDVVLNLEGSMSVLTESEKANNIEKLKSQQAAIDSAAALQIENEAREKKLSLEARQSVIDNKKAEDEELSDLDAQLDLDLKLIDQKEERELAHDIVLDEISQKEIDRMNAESERLLLLDEQKLLSSEQEIARQQEAAQAIQNAAIGTALIVGRLLGKGAIAQKAAALFSIFTNTAAAVLNAVAPVALGGLGPVAGLPLAVATGVFGAAQAAAVIAQPIPKFQDGGVMEYAGKAQVGEIGAELMVTPDGNLSVVGEQGRETRTLEKGTQIFDNSIYKKLASGLSMDKENNDEVSDGINRMIRAEKQNDMIMMIGSMKRDNEKLANSFHKSISSLPVHQWNIRNGKLEESVRKGTTTFHDWQNKNQD